MRENEAAVGRDGNALYSFGDRNHGDQGTVLQVENADAARPQSGLARATIVYEYVAEGGISRFSAIYPVPPAAQVGPIRSARLATLSLLQLYKGMLVYSGASEYIQGLLDSSGLPRSGGIIGSTV